MKRLMRRREPESLAVCVPYVYEVFVPRLMCRIRCFRFPLSIPAERSEVEKLIGKKRSSAASWGTCVSSCCQTVAALFS